MGKGRGTRDAGQAGREVGKNNDDAWGVDGTECVQTRQTENARGNVNVKTMNDGTTMLGTLRERRDDEKE